MQADFIDYIAQIIGEPISGFLSMSGGDISEVYKISTKSDELLLKKQPGKRGFEMLTAEKKGLESIRSTNTIKTPEVYHIGEHDDESFLLMAYIPTKNPSAKDFEKLGQQLAGLHLMSASDYGFIADNFIGSLPQSNHKNHNWTKFYVKERLQVQLDLAKQKSLLSTDEIPDFETMYDACNSLFLDIKPSLLHGDLWGGNFLIASDGTPYVIDPAIYYGHSEVDLAMSRLFGGFSSSFYEAYQGIIPQQPNSQARNDLYQLYYLLVHLNLFGRNYYAGVKRILEKYFF